MVVLERSLKGVEMWDGWKVIQPWGGWVGLEGSLKVVEPWDAWVGLEGSLKGGET